MKTILKQEIIIKQLDTIKFLLRTLSNIIRMKNSLIIFVLRNEIFLTLGSKRSKEEHPYIRGQPINI